VIADELAESAASSAWELSHCDGFSLVRLLHQRQLGFNNRINCDRILKRLSESRSISSRHCQQVQLAEPASKRVVSLALSANQQWLAAAHTDHCIRVYSLSSTNSPTDNDRNIVQLLFGHQRLVWTLQWHPRLPHILASGLSWRRHSRLAGAAAAAGVGGGRVLNATTLLTALSEVTMISSLAFHPGPGAEDRSLMAYATSTKVAFVNWLTGAPLFTWRFLASYSRTAAGRLFVASTNSPDDVPIPLVSMPTESTAATAAAAAAAESRSRLVYEAVIAEVSRLYPPASSGVSSSTSCHQRQIEPDIVDLECHGQIQQQSGATSRRIHNFASPDLITNVNSNNNDVAEENSNRATTAISSSSGAIDTNRVRSSIAEVTCHPRVDPASMRATLTDTGLLAIRRFARAAAMSATNSSSNSTSTASTSAAAAAAAAAGTSSTTSTSRRLLTQLSSAGSLSSASAIGAAYSDSSSQRNFANPALFRPDRRLAQAPPGSELMPDFARGHAVYASPSAPVDHADYGVGPFEFAEAAASAGVDPILRAAIDRPSQLGQGQPSKIRVWRAAAQAQSKLCPACYVLNDASIDLSKGDGPLLIHNQRILGAPDTHSPLLYTTACQSATRVCSVRTRAKLLMVGYRLPASLSSPWSASASRLAASLKSVRGLAKASAAPEGGLSLRVSTSPARRLARCPPPTIAGDGSRRDSRPFLKLMKMRDPLLAAF
uniref:WD_REPEATS_REGION domain-containing protein n=1 Tax=Macrostomum lignano TaxID=282301 RepID=A0A1I8JNR7_9PLAT